MFVNGLKSIKVAKRTAQHGFGKDRRYKMTGVCVLLTIRKVDVQC